MHLKQALLDARVNTGGDDALDLLARARKGVLLVLVTVSVVKGETTSVPQRGSGQVTHGVFSAREHVAPQELAFGQCLAELGKQVLLDGCGEGGDKV